jgi:hypothetical protein
MRSTFFWVSGLAVAFLSGGLAAVAEEPARPLAGQAIPLFDGKNLDAWQTLAGKPVTQGWVVEADGTLHRKQRAGHIVTRQEFENFELHFEWKIAPGGNSGIKYRVRKYGRVPLGCEFQLLDDEKHRNARNPKTSAGSLYALFAPVKDKPLHPAGTFNTSRIVANGSHLEHWLNGTKILAVEVASPDWEKAIAKSKFRKARGFGQGPGPIMLQDHGNEVWFRNIILTPLPPSTVTPPR